MSEIRVNNLSNESNTGGPTISGITTFSSPYFFVPPVGNTAQRPENPQKGAIRFNTDSKHLEYFRGNTFGWSEIEASNQELNGGARGVWMGGRTTGGGNVDVIEYCTISTLGNNIDFGNLTVARNGPSGCSNSTRAIWSGGATSPTSTNVQDTIDYTTIATLGDATDFGNLTAATSFATGAASSTRGVIAGGHVAPAGSSTVNTIEYVTISSLGNATNFGDLTEAIKMMGGCSDVHGGLG